MEAMISIGLLRAPIPASKSESGGLLLASSQAYPSVPLATYPSTLKVEKGHNRRTSCRIFRLSKGGEPLWEVCLSSRGWGSPRATETDPFEQCYLSE